VTNGFEAKEPGAFAARWLKCGPPIVEEMAEETSDPRIYLAAERTFLAWIRTGLALMGFGFVVARFGLFLRELEAARAGTMPYSYGWSVYFGTALVLVGVAVNVLAAGNHVRMVRRLARGERIAQRPSRLGIFISAALAALGTVMAVYLLVVR
jgi:putative membrane protein